MPLHLRNAPTKLMKQVGYGDGYVYNPLADPEEAAKQTYLPDDLAHKKFYSGPRPRGRTAPAQKPQPASQQARAGSMQPQRPPL